MRAAPRAARISALVALVLAAAWLFWPSALGGGTTYVTTHGVSMEPRFHTGDLAILRSADHYAVGDVVAYRSATLKTTVMHRIVKVDGNRFVIQGDNNSWLDPDQPSVDLVQGKLWLRIPQGGKVLAALSSPAGVGLLGAAALVLTAVVRRPRSRHSARRSRRRPALRAPAFPAPVRAYARQVALTAGAVALVAGIGGGVLVALPSTQASTRTLHVTQQGQFSYSGTAAAGTTYPDGRITTGDTVWTKLAKDLTVSFTNTVSGPDLAALQGAMRLDVTISSADGWSSYLNSSPVVALANGSSTAVATIETPRAAALLAKHYAEIGTPGAAATLTVTPVAVTTGTAGGEKFRAGSPAPLAFTVDGTSLRMAGKADAALAPSTTTDVTVGQVVARKLTVRGLTISIGLARFLAAVVLVLALAVLAAAAWIGRTTRGDAADEFVVKHAARILPVAAFDPGPTVIDVSDAEALHRVAERFDTLVLHHAGEDADVFAVRDVDATYRFVVPGGREARARPPVPVPVPVRMPVPEVDDATAPLPLIVSTPQPSVSAGLWGKFA
jgi:signal peptidase I